MTIKTVLSGWLLLFSTLAFAAPADPAIDFTFKMEGKEVSKLKLQEILNSFPAKNLKVYDPNEKADVTYRVVPFNALMKKVFGADWDNSPATGQVGFICQDGYKPEVPRKMFSQYDPYLAFERKGSDFVLVNHLEGGKKVPLAPFYLVWDTHKNKTVLNEQAHIWPYQLVAVNITKAARELTALNPPKGASDAAKRGHQYFVKDCAVCHALNGEGGQVGPELNYPTNITEMLQPGILRRWLDDPKSLRWNTAMPGVPANVSDRQKTIDDVIAYLTAMKDSKIRPKAAK